MFRHVLPCSTRYGHLVRMVRSTGPRIHARSRSSSPHDFTDQVQDSPARMRWHASGVIASKTPPELSCIGVYRPALLVLVNCACNCSLVNLGRNADGILVYLDSTSDFAQEHPPSGDSPPIATLPNQASTLHPLLRPVRHLQWLLPALLAIPVYAPGSP